MRRVVVTGYGAVSCAGNSVAELWSSMVEGRCGLGPVTKFDTTEYRTKIAGEVRNFDITKYMSAKDAKRLDMFCQYAIAAGDEAMLSAGLSQDPAIRGIDDSRFGVLVSTGIGGLIVIADQQDTLRTRGPGRISPLAIPMMIGDSAPGCLSIRYGAKGPNFSLMSACATGCHSIGEAWWMIRRNDADVMLAGGTEESVMEICLAGFSAMKAMSQRNDDPLHASRPFDLNRDGFVASEGSGVLVLEELEHAKRRGAKILAEVVGYGATGDAFHITSPDPEGRGDAKAIRVAMDHAGIKPEDIDYINAHGTSTHLNDLYETKAIKLALGEAAAKKVSVSSTKGVTGHALGAAGGLECIACVKAIENGIVPPTINYETPDPECDLDVTPNVAVKRDIRYAINNNLGFGGHNAAVIFKRYED
jgi:3-oxoacyl-[acyl-carrier-protein] synthase II